MSLLTEVFYQPGMDVRGMVSSRDSASLRPGEFKTFQNARLRSGCIRVRGGIVDKSVSGLASGSVCGSAKLVLNGTTYQLVAIDTGATIRCYYGVDATFTEFTAPASNNKYGNTRFATGNWVVFEAVRDTTASTIAPFTAARTGLDLVFATDGATAVVWDPSGSSTDNSWTSPHANVWHPLEGKVRQEATYPYFINLVATNTAAGALTGTGTLVDNKAHDVTGGRCPTWGFTAVSDAAILTVTTGTTLCKNKQVWMVFDCPDDPLILEYLKVEVYDSLNAVFRTLYDASVATSERPTIVPLDFFEQDPGGPGGRGFKIAYFSVDPTVCPDVTYTDIKLTYKGSAAYSAEVFFNLIAIGGSGTTPGGSQFCAANTNPGSRAESVGIVCDNKFGVSLKNLGCQDTRNYVRIPDWAGSYFKYNVTVQQPSNSDRDAGVEYCLVYRRSALKPGDDPSKPRPFYHVASYQFSTYSTGSHSWTNAASATALQDIVIGVDTSAYALRTAPDAYNVAAPPCQSLAVAGGRLFCGGARPGSVGSTANPADCYVSEQDHPLRHREILKIDQGAPSETSGTCAKFPGEKVMRIVPMVGSLIGDEAAIVLTDQNVYALPGPSSIDLTRPRRISEKGTLSPWSVCVRGNKLIYLDEDRKLVTLIPGQEPVDLSTGRMENILEAIPTSRLDNVYACVYRNRYYMSYTLGGGSSNKAVIVYDFIFDGFARDVTLNALSWNQFHALDVGVSGQLRFWSDTGNLYEHDSSTTSQDAGSNAVTPYIEGRMVGDQFHAFSFERLSVHCQQDFGNTLSAYWTGRPSGLTQPANPGTIPLTPRVYGTVTPASTSAAADTVAFSEPHKVSSGQPCTPHASVNVLVAGTLYYLGAVDSTHLSFHTTQADALAGTNLVNLNATAVTQIDLIGTHVVGYNGEAALRGPVGISDASASPIWTGGMSGNKEIYYLGGEYRLEGEIANA